MLQQPGRCAGAAVTENSNGGAVSTQAVPNIGKVSCSRRCPRIRRRSWIRAEKCNLVRRPLSIRKEGDAGTLAGEKGDGEEEEDSDGNGKEKGARRDRRSRDRCVPRPLHQP